MGGGDSTDPAEPENPATKFTVTFKTAHGKNPASIEVEKDTVLTAEQLKKLTFEGFIFKGWFDGETEAKAGEYKVTKDVTLTAKWKESSSTGPDPVEPENPVTDPESDPVDPVDPVEPEDPAVEPENPVDPEPENLSEYDNLIAALNNSILQDYQIADLISLNCKNIGYELLLNVDFNVTDFIQILFEKNILKSNNMEKWEDEDDVGYSDPEKAAFGIVYKSDMYMIVLKLPEKSVIWKDSCILYSDGKDNSDYSFYVYKRKSN